MCHPDKGTEMLLYELGVDESYRRRGIGRVVAQVEGKHRQGQERCEPQREDRPRPFATPQVDRRQQDRRATDTR